MKQKSKPIARADIRERMERKFRARGAVVFHLLLVHAAGMLLLYNLPDLWAARFSVGFQDAVLLYGAFGMSGALHFIRYHFRHGRGHDRHEAEIEARINAQLRGARADEAEEQEELVRLQLDDKLKNLRLVWQHLVVFVGVLIMASLVHAQSLRPSRLMDLFYWRDYLSFFGIWGIGLAAHILRYVFTYGKYAALREARIDAQVERELEREQRRSARHAAQAADSMDETAFEPALTLDDLEVVQEQSRS